ncbi:hypothetical protein [Streptomyces sp. NPDC059262]|uniref:hypothetical protein n=1 Tax=Streptomyces sp. NPDC059262 TaxID=3346797 RepID=UPI0036B01069
MAVSVEIAVASVQRGNAIDVGGSPRHDCGWCPRQESGAFGPAAVVAVVLGPVRAANCLEWQSHRWRSIAIMKSP